MASLDRSAPVVNIPDTLRVPVYQTLSTSLEDTITDMSPYTITLDSDITTDVDANGVYEDDFLANGTGYTLSPESLIVGPYDSLGTRMMNVRVVDEYGNTTIKSLKIEVSAPIPKITSISATGTLF